MGDYIIGIISGMAIFCTGLYISVHNVDSINNLLTQGFAVISIWVGLYIIVNTSKEKIEEWMR